ncbi:MAG TPA: YceI family protein [Kofleriaceae bacterium]
MTRWNIDGSHSTAEFSVRHLMITNVRGRFGTLEGTVEYDPAKPEASTINVSIDATSIDTREEKRDAHLKSADFFDTEKFPKITFVSKSVKKTDDGFAATGDLTMHGVTKEVTLEVETPSGETKDPWGNQRIGASAHAKINRKDWGLGWNAVLEAGGVAVGEQVKINIEVSMVKAA